MTKAKSTFEIKGSQQSQVPKGARFPELLPAILASMRNSNGGPRCGAPGRVGLVLAFDGANRREQVADLYFQGGGDRNQIQRRDISFTALDAAVIGAVKACPCGKLLLREAGLLAELADLPAQGDEVRMALAHRPTVGAGLPWGHGL